MNEHRAVALGFFDGVHLGHAALLGRTSQVARERGLIPSVLSFDEHPLSRVSGKYVPLLTGPEDRMSLIQEGFGIEESIILHFDNRMMEMPWEQFFDSLIEEYNAEYLVYGHDYSCGYRGQGKAELLSERCSKVGIGFDVIPPVERNGLRISSSAIRELIMAGEMEQAQALYGHPHLMSGVVRSRKKLGRTIDAPTINLQFDRDIVIPKHGVYASIVTLPDGSRHYGVTNVGVRPTVENTDIVNAETYILDYSGNLYGQKVKLEFYYFVRSEIKFNSIDSLKHQIQSDANSVKEYFKIS